jgi:hypothetical protein
MSLLAALLLLQTAAATPAPTPTPVPTPAPAPAKGTSGTLGASGAPGNSGSAAWGGSRTLSDIARERKLKASESTASTKKGSVSVASGDSGAPASVSPTPAGTVTPGSGRVSPVVVVDGVHHDGVVGVNGQVRVSGSARNAGNVAACDVSVIVRLYDDRGRYLVSGAAKADEPILRPGGSASFAVWVQVPPGVVGSMGPTGPGSGPVSGSVTIEGKWRTLGRAEAELQSVAEACPGEKPEG